MEQLVVWLTFASVMIFPFIGWVFNALIKNNINAIESKQKEDKLLFFKRLDEDRKMVEENYVRSDIYQQAMKYHTERNDSELKNLLSIMNTQFQSVEDKIDGIKDLINEKINNRNHGG